MLTATIRTARTLFSEHAKSSRYDPTFPDREARLAYLEGVMDCIRTMFGNARSPYQPEAYGPDLRGFYVRGFENR